MRCKSSCKGLSYEGCVNRCTYTKKNYCRLSSRYAMRGPSCKVTRRFSKKRPDDARRVLTRAIEKSKLFISILCSDSGMCIALGNRTKEISQFFNGFTGFEYATDMKTIARSGNGYIKEITYTRDNYVSYAILKSAIKKSSDNLFYEYVVGLGFVNTIMKRLPCFLETYGMYYYPAQHTMKTSDDLQNLMSLTIETKADFKKACDYPTNIGILLQHVRGPTLDTIMNSTEFKINDMTYVLFIIYHALASVSESFTHYDLHTNNIILVKPFEDKCIRFIYHDIGIEFNCLYLPKIIDYGRSFFKGVHITAEHIYTMICDECVKCGEASGFSWLTPRPNKHSYWISSSVKNESHDLRLLTLLPIGLPLPLTQLLTKVVYNDKYGTKENLSTNFLIYNVKGFYRAISSIIVDNNRPVGGILHIYADKPMFYERV